MIGRIDIENSKTKKVITLTVPIIEHIDKKIIKFDISKIKKDELKILVPAISEKENTSYTDIELFYIDNDESPYFGPDYNFYIKDDMLIGIYNRNIYKRKDK